MNNVKGRIQRAEAALDLDPDPEAEAKQAAEFSLDVLVGVLKQDCRTTFTDQERAAIRARLSGAQLTPEQQELIQPFAHAIDIMLAI